MTIGRLLVTPILIAMVAVWGPTWAAVVVAFCVCSTDGLDGWIARRQGATTSGAFLDPLADKAVVRRHLRRPCGSRRHHLVRRSVLIAAREISMSVYRVLHEPDARSRSPHGGLPSPRRSCRTWFSGCACCRRWLITTGRSRWRSGSPRRSLSLPVCST